MATCCPHSRPISTEFSPYHVQYVNLVEEIDILSALRKQLDQVVDEWMRIDPPTSLVRHAPYTWSLREVIGHLNDAERIFGYRALRFARGDSSELPGFEENDYVRNAEFDRCQWRDLIDEFHALRRANILMLNNVPDHAWTQSGIASGNRVTVHALAYIMVGHVRHHANIIRNRIQQPSAILA
jgi:hypothetical protein